MSPIPERLLLVLATTVFTVMLSVGLGISIGEFRVVWQRPSLLLRGLFATLVAVPVVALVISRALLLPRLEQIGVALMAISPRAPIALRNALGAGGHRSFAPSLQIAVALLASLSMPFSIAAMDRLYAGSASIAPWDVAKQVFVAQLLPLGLGIAVRRARASLATFPSPRWHTLAMHFSPCSPSQQSSTCGTSSLPRGRASRRPSS